MVRFGDVVRNVDISERDPLTNGIERYVGLDHIDPESLHIKRWGQIEDGTSFTRKFLRGQVLFGKRRAYQRKVAVAEFDGICSGDILVFEAKDNLLPELLPFIVQSDPFYEHALSTSAGSLSPRTKWKELAAYDFALPPKDEQRRIADILWAAEETISSMQSTLEHLKFVKKLISDELISKGIGHTHFKSTEIGELPASWKVEPIQKLCDLVIDCKNRTPPYVSSGYPVVRTVNVRNGRFVESDLCYTDEVSYLEWTKRGQPQPGDILITREAPLGEVCIIPDGMQICLGQRMMLFRPKSEHILNSFLLAVLLSSNTQKRLHALAGGSTVGHVRVGDIKN